jgi:hypothetical protein
MNYIKGAIEGKMSKRAVGDYCEFSLNFFIPNKNSKAHQYDYWPDIRVIEQYAQRAITNFKKTVT